MNDKGLNDQGGLAMSATARVFGTALTAAVLMTVPFSVLAAEKYVPSGSNSFMYPGEPVPRAEMRVTIFGSLTLHQRGV